MRKFLAISALVSALLVSTPSEASVSTASIQVEEQSTGVAIHIDNLQVVDNDIRIRGDRLFIDLKSVSVRQRMKLEGDKTVSSVEIVAGRNPRLIVRIRHGRDKTKKIGLAATVENIDGGIVMHIPRWPIGRENTPMVAAKVTPIVSAKTTAIEPAPVAAIPSPAPEPAEQPTALATQKSAVEGTTEPEAQAAPPITGKPEAAAEIAGKESSEGSSTGLIVGFMLLIAGAGVVVWRSRQKTTEGDDYENMRVVASKQLGGKSKIVWLSVANREMVVAVGEGGTQLLTEWRRDEELLGGGDVPIARTMLNIPASQQPPRAALARGSAPMPVVRPEDSVSMIPSSAPSLFTPIARPKPDTIRAAPENSPGPKNFGGPMGGYRFQSALTKAQSLQDNTERPRNEIRQQAPSRSEAPVNAQSPALAGLMRLRQQAPSVNDDVATQDDVADAEWARELLRATRDSVLQGAG